MGPDVGNYIKTIPLEHRVLFDRVHRLILEACPAVEVVFSYKMPTYRAGKHRLHVAAWRHGVSLYGWKGHGDGGFSHRHPEVVTSTGTIELRSGQETMADEEIRELARAAMDQK